MATTNCILDTLKIKPTAAEMSWGQAKQMQRVKNDEKKDADLKYVTADHRDTQRAFWNENLQMNSENKRLKKILQEIKREIELGNKTLTELRRAQLEHLLRSEDQMYESELNSMGLTLYKERL